MTRPCYQPSVLERRTAGLWALLLLGCGGPLGSELFVHGAPPSRADAVVVLGNRPARTAGGDAAPEITRRVARGVEVFEGGHAPRLVLVGSAEEAEVMEDLALALGVHPEALRTDGRSRHTADNARYGVAAACGARRPCRVIVVSSAYHLRRARHLFECAGAEVQVAAAAIPDDAGYQVSFTAYEYAVRLVNIFRDACALAAGE